MINLPLRLVSPATVLRTAAMPARKPNAELRSREHLTNVEVERLVVAKNNRWGHRDATMIQPNGCAEQRKRPRDHFKHVIRPPK